MIIHNQATPLINMQVLKIMTALHDVDTSMTGRQIARVIRYPKSRTITLLNELAQIGSLSVKKTGNALTYQPNTEHFQWQIFNTIQTFQPQLDQKLSQLLPENLHQANQHSALFIFGSVARRQSTPASDIDLGIIVPDEENKHAVQTRIDNQRAAIEAFTGNELSPFLITWTELEKMVTSRESLIASWTLDAQHVAGAHVQDLIAQILAATEKKTYAYA